MALAAGIRLGVYEILSAVGAGGMGQVYRARDTQLGRDVALKILPDSFLHDPERLARFRREAQVLATLNHPHIAQIYGLDEVNGSPFLALEFVDGESLDTRIARGPMPLDEALAIARQIAEALEAAHEKGIIHRDLKPANIALTSAHQVKVLDFGLAKATESASGASSGVTNSPTITSPALMTGVGVLLGTAAYMSPEQAKGRAADRRSDIWAFGCLLYEMLTGKRAFEGEDVGDTLAFVLTKDPDLSGLPANTPEPIRRVLRRALQKDRTRRLESAADARLEIDDALASPSVDASTATPLTSRRAPWIVGAVATLVLGTLGAAWIVSQRRPPQAETPVLRFQVDPPPGGQLLIGPGATVGTVAISPDGRTVAYVARVNGRIGLWIRPLGTSAATLLPGTEGAAFPIWAPDSESLAFFTRDKLERIPLSGAQPATVSKLLGPDNASGSTLLRSGSWNDEGSILFGGSSGLLRVPAAGGIPTALTMLDASRGETGHGYPQILPGGRVLFTVTSNLSETSGTYAASLSNPAQRIKVLDVGGALYARGTTDGTDYLVWPSDGTLKAQPFDVGRLKTIGEPRVLATEGDDSRLLVSVSNNGILAYGRTRALTQFNWFDRTGRFAAALGEPLRTFMFRLSPDSQQVLLQQNRSSDLWLLDSMRGLTRRITAGPGTASTHPVWSPDGRTIAFARLGSGNLFRKAANGLGDEELVIHRSAILPTDWSGDGRWVLDYESDPKTRLDLWMLPVNQDGTLRQDDKPRPYVRTPFNERFGRFSPGAKPRWVAYQSDESGQYEVYIDTFPEPRGKIRISTAGGTYPQWSADGRELFYISPDYKLMAASLKETADSIEPSAPRELFAISAPGTFMSPYEVSGDGQRFLVLSAHEETTQSVTVIVNWPALLKKGAGAP
jgi:serine/threonine protein kinase/Tol biopolymer transport system component